jgi:hypothetical protein
MSSIQSAGKINSTTQLNAVVFRNLPLLTTPARQALRTACENVLNGTKNSTEFAQALEVIGKEHSIESSKLRQLQQALTRGSAEVPSKDVTPSFIEQQLKEPRTPGGFCTRARFRGSSASG